MQTGAIYVFLNILVFRKNLQFIHANQYITTNRDDAPKFWMTDIIPFVVRIPNVAIFKSMWDLPNMAARKIFFELPQERRS